MISTADNFLNSVKKKFRFYQNLTVSPEEEKVSLSFRVEVLAFYAKKCSKLRIA